MPTTSTGASNATLIGLLGEVQRKPELYVGSISDKKLALIRIEMLIIGYQLAIGLNRLPEASFDIAFSEYLLKKYPWDLSIGPVQAIIAATDSPELAWNLFWREFECFRASSAVSSSKKRGSSSSKATNRRRFRRA